MLIKLRAPAGPARTEVLQLAEIFRARVVDVSDSAITLCVSGDPGKVRAVRAVLHAVPWLHMGRVHALHAAAGPCVHASLWHACSACTAGRAC